jgi:hypothetical protein
MAVLGATSLTGCNSIPQFIAGGSKTVFQNATSPVSWTKDTTVNEGMLRVVNGASLSPGGSITFSQAFVSNKPISVTLQQQSIGLTTTSTTDAYPASFGSGQDGSPPDSSGSALPTAQFASHNHPYIRTSPTVLTSGIQPASVAASVANPTNLGGVGLGGQHSHAFAGHSHQVDTAGTILHGHAVSGQHDHPISSTDSFDILYVDMIICTKD